MLHRPLTFRPGPPTQGCHNPVSNKFQLRPNSFMFHPKSNRRVAKCSVSTSQSRRPYLQQNLSGMNFFVAPFPPCNIFLSLFFLRLVQGLFVGSRSKDPCRDLLPTTSSVLWGGSIGSLKGGGGSWGSWGCNKPGTPSLASSYPASSLQNGKREGNREVKDEREEQRHASG